MWLNRLIPILDVYVAKRGQACRPALAHLFVHALQDFGSQIVTVILGDGRHDVEGQRPGGSGAKLVV